MVQEAKTETEGVSEKERNFRELEADRDRWKAEAEALRPFKHESIVRRAGFDPESGEGKSLIRDLDTGLVKEEEGKELHEILVAHADAEYGWKPKTPLTPTERVQVEGSAHLSTLSQSTTSDQTPADTHSEYAQKIEAAREAGDFRLASRLQLEYERKIGKAKAG